MRGYNLTLKSSNQELQKGTVFGDQKFLSWLKTLQQATSGKFCAPWINPAPTGICLPKAMQPDLLRRTWLPPTAWLSEYTSEYNCWASVVSQHPQRWSCPALVCLYDHHPARRPHQSGQWWASMLASLVPQLYMYEKTVVGNLCSSWGKRRWGSESEQPCPLTTCLYYGRLAIRCWSTWLAQHCCMLSDLVELRWNNLPAQQA